MAQTYLSPSAVVIGQQGRTLWVACATAQRVTELELASGKVLRSIPVTESPLGLALSRDNQRLFIVSGGAESRVFIVDTTSGVCEGTIAAGHTAMSPILSPDEQTLYLCNRFNDEVAFVDLKVGSVRQRVKVAREPVAASLTKDGKFLLVANHLHAGAADAGVVTAAVTVIDTAGASIFKNILLPNGSGQLRGISISPDGKLACVTHLISRYRLPTTQIDRGWINNNAISLIDLTRMELLNAVLLDNVDRGAANPWGIAWTSDGRHLVVAHSGTHEVSVIEVPRLLAKLSSVASSSGQSEDTLQVPGVRTPADVPNDLAFLLDVRTRLKLPETDRGPRAIVSAGEQVYVANYFSDTISVIDMPGPRMSVRSFPLSTLSAPDAVREGEALFNDASICFQGWQSCASCHSSDGRVDGMNWDNLNDGVGNPKNVRSLLLAHRTPPAMTLAVREDAEQAVRAGIRHSLFAVRPEREALAIDEYLKSLQPIPSPHLVHGQLSTAAQRGKQLFFDAAVGCADCHTPPLFTDLHSYDVGTRGKYDGAADEFDTPTLVELWRTAPYLHDGRAVNVVEVLTHWNRDDKHGRTSHLSSAQTADLAAFILSL